MTNEDPISLPDKIINVTQSLRFESLDEVNEKLIPLLHQYDFPNAYERSIARVNTITF